LGVLLLVIFAARVIWRLTKGRRLPAADSGVLHTVAKAIHWGLYTLLAAMLVVGLFLAWTRGDSMFNLFRIPAYAPGNRALADQVQEIHATIGYLILAVAGLHAAAALLHGLVWRDGVLSRMLTRE
jgi:cytochrome b561